MSDATESFWVSGSTSATFEIDATDVSGDGTVTVLLECYMTKGDAGDDITQAGYINDALLLGTYFPDPVGG